MYWLGLQAHAAASRVQLPAWLSVQPVRGVVPAGGSATISFGCLLSQRMPAPLGVRSESLRRSVFGN